MRSTHGQSVVRSLFFHGFESDGEGYATLCGHTLTDFDLVRDLQRCEPTCPNCQRELRRDDVDRATRAQSSRRSAYR